MGIMSGILDWYRNRSLLAKAVLQAAMAVVVFYGGALLEQEVQDRFAEDSPGVFVVRTLVVGGLLVLFVAVSLVARTKLDSLEHREHVRRRQLAYAWNLMDQYVAMQVAAVRIDPSLTGDRQRQQFIESVSTSPERLMELVREVYRFFDSQHASSGGALDFVLDFEVTFMAMSYRDGKITIPAYANRQGRAPPSLALREKNPSIYENTVAARAYTETRPALRIVADTMADPNYVDLYPGQKQRIRSSLVFPVLSDVNKVLGVLVVHCNREKFFVEADRGFWNELLEIFGKRLALEKARLDVLVASEVARSLKFDRAVPF